MRQILCLLTALIALQNGSADADWPQAYRMDANLYDICFVDAQIGFAISIGPIVVGNDALDLLALLGAYGRTLAAAELGEQQCNNLTVSGFAWRDVRH